MFDSLRKTRLDMDSLNSLLRKKNVFPITEVDYAIFETDGSLSVMKKETQQTITKSDMNIQPTFAVFPTSIAVITDGKINTNNLRVLNLDQ